MCAKNVKLDRSKRDWLRGDSVQRDWLRDLAPKITSLKLFFLEKKNVLLGFESQFV